MRPPGLGDLALGWRVDIGLTTAFALTAAAYLAGTSRGGVRWSPRRSLSFLGGLVAVAVALESGVGTYDDRLLSVHMVQHEILMLVAAPLLLAGNPVTLALRALSGHRRRALARLLGGRTVGVLSHPAVALAALAVAMLGTHLTPLYGLAVTNATVHVLEHLLYLGAALLFWAVVLPPGPVPRRLSGSGQLIYLMAAMPLMSVVGVVLETEAVPRYMQYAAPAARMGVSALADQRLAGALMWIAGTLAMAAIALRSAWRSLLEEERRQRVRERREDAERSRAGEPLAGAWS